MMHLYTSCFTHTGLPCTLQHCISIILCDRGFVSVVKDWCVISWCLPIALDTDTIEFTYKDSTSKFFVVFHYDQTGCLWLSCAACLLWWFSESAYYNKFIGLDWLTLSCFGPSPWNKLSLDLWFVYMICLYDMFIGSPLTFSLFRSFREPSM